MNILASLRQAHRRRQAVRQLRSLPPELLGDIGIEPGQIHEVVSDMLTKVRSPAPRSVPKPAPDLLLFKAAMFSGAGWFHGRQRSA